MSTTVTDARGARPMATGNKQDAGEDRLAKHAVEQVNMRLPGTANPSTEMPDAAPTGNSAQTDQSARSRPINELRCAGDWRSSPRLEANRVERAAADGSEPLEAYDLGIQRDVHDALAKMADRTYGGCETCQGLIPVARLKAVPYARRCLACQEREENGWHPVQRLVGGVAEVPAGEPQGRSEAGS